SHFLCDLETVGSGHVDVEQSDIGALVVHGRKHLGAAGALGDDLEVGLHPQQCGKRLAHHPLVVGDEQCDHGTSPCAALSSPAPSAGARSRLMMRPNRSSAFSVRTVAPTDSALSC